METVELFCGTKSFSKVAKKRGHNTFTNDIEEYFNPTLCKDIFEVQREDLPKQIDVLWASVVCTTWSVASLRHYWVNGKPKNIKTWIGIAMLMKTLTLIEEIKKDNLKLIWFIENPRGMMRKHPLVQKLHRKTVTYCQYGDFRQKPTDIFTNLESWIPRPMCKRGDTCHK